MKVMIEFSDQLSQDNWHLTLTTKVLVTNFNHYFHFSYLATKT